MLLHVSLEVFQVCVRIIKNEDKQSCPINPFRTFAGLLDEHQVGAPLVDFFGDLLSYVIREEPELLPL